MNFFNLFMIVLIILVVVYIGYRYYVSLEDMRDDDTFSEDDYTDLITLKNKISKEFSKMLDQNLRERNLSKAQLEKKQKSLAILRKSLKEAAFGDSKAKKRIKLYIKDMLLDPKLNLGIDEKTIDSVIPFGKLDDLKSQDKFEIILYIAYNLMINEETNKPYGQQGFAKVIKDYDLLKPVTVNGEKVYDITKEKLDMVFDSLSREYHLTFNDKLEILSQRIFEMYKGFGVVDMLFDTGVDEIAGGLSGISKDGYEINNSSKNLVYTYQSIWIMVGGVKLRMSCLSFGSQEELERVVSNIYKYGANAVLSRKNGKVVSSMKNGSRIVAMRPPFANTYAFIARKFDSTPSIAPEDLISARGTIGNSIIALKYIRWLIKGQRNIAITGAQGTGKSTMLKSVIRYIPSTLSLRVQEIASELNLNYAYPYRNIISFQETESIDSQAGLNFQKKTSGDVNIIGEVAEAIQANFVIQTAMVASLFAMFTHHAKTAKDLIYAIANNLLDPKCGIYKEKKEAVEMAAKILNIDIHLENQNNTRYIERITEIIPNGEVLYPSEVNSNKTHEDDELEFFKRTTDREPFKVQDLVRYENGEFVFVNLPSENMMKEIRSKLTPEEDAEFLKDMEYISTLKRAPATGPVRNLKIIPEIFEADDEVQTVTI